jgi:ABC-2 type transport system ATP-binding protein
MLNKSKFMTTISIKNLTKYYPHKKGAVKALDDISVEISDNQIVGLLGQNGSGKTTFIKSCTNLISFDGNITLEENGKKRKLTHKDYSAVLEGNRNIYWKLTVLENIRFFAGLRGIKYSKIKNFASDLLKALYIYDKKDCLVETLSRGMQQKTALICTLVVDTPVVFLDEPTLGLDVESKNQLKEFFSHGEFVKNKLILATSHDLEFIRTIASKHLFIKSGKIHDIDMKNINNNIYKITFDCSLTQNTEFAGVEFKSNCIYVNTEQIRLSTVLNYLEHENVNITDILKMNNDVETIYLNFIKEK